MLTLFNNSDVPSTVVPCLPTDECLSPPDMRKMPFLNLTIDAK